MGELPRVQLQRRSSTSSGEYFSKPYDTVRSKLAALDWKFWAKIFVVAIVLALLIALVILLSQRFRKSNKAKGSPGKDTQLMIEDASSLKEVVSKKPVSIPKPGSNWGMSFWLFLDDFEYTNGMKSVLNLYKDDTAMPTLAVWLDKDVPRMWIAVRSIAPNADKYTTPTNKTETALPSTLMDVLLEKSCSKAYLDSLYSTDATDPDSARNQASCMEYNGHFLTVVDYIPLKQWTHVTIGVDGPILTVYKDGTPVRSTRVKTLVQSPDENVVKVGKYKTTSSLFTGSVKSVMMFKSSTPNTIDARHGFTSPPFTDRYKSGSNDSDKDKKDCKC